MRDALGTGGNMYVYWEGKGGHFGAGLSIGSGVIFCCCVWLDTRSVVRKKSMFGMT